MAAQETEEAELVALAALVFFDAAQMHYVTVGGTCPPSSESAEELRRRLVARGILPSVEPPTGARP